MNRRNAGIIVAGSAFLLLALAAWLALFTTGTQAAAPSHGLPAAPAAAPARPAPSTANGSVVALTDANGVRIYAVGGNDINSTPASTVRVYDPVADSLTTLTSDPWPASPAHVPGGYAVVNNKLYIFGGFSALGNGAVYADTWVFDPTGVAGSRWTQLTSASLSIARGYIAGAALDGKIYAIGGDTWVTSTHQLIP